MCLNVCLFNCVFVGEALIYLVYVITITKRKKKENKKEIIR